MQAALVMNDVLRDGAGIHPREVVDRIQDRVPRPQAEKQRDVAWASLEVDDHRGLACEAPDVCGAVHGQRGGTGAALGAEVADDHAPVDATRVPEREVPPSL